MRPPHSTSNDELSDMENHERPKYKNSSQSQTYQIKCKQVKTTTTNNNYNSPFIYK
jgi:hypothetical protein